MFVRISKHCARRCHERGIDPAIIREHVRGFDELQGVCVIWTIAGKYQAVVQYNKKIAVAVTAYRKGRREDAK